MDDTARCLDRASQLSTPSRHHDGSGLERASHIADLPIIRNRAALDSNALPSDSEAPIELSLVTDHTQRRALAGPSAGRAFHSLPELDATC